MKSLLRVTALAPLLFALTGSPASAKDREILNATVDYPTKVMTVSGTRLLQGRDRLEVAFNGVAVPATYNATTGKILVSLAVIPPPGTYLLAVGRSENPDFEFDVTIGSAGPQGIPGIMGPMGPQGPQGLKGDTGATGATGPQGLQGNKGDKGDPGVAGPQGAQGPIGLTGSSGEQGAQGVQGPKGDKGDVGATGDQGNVGPIGPQGPVGGTGPQGLVGATGPQGAVGPTMIQVLGGVQSFATSAPFVVPAGVSSVLVEMWGGGGAGASGYPTGGGGGGYLRATVAVTPSQTIAVTVGQGGAHNTGNGSSAGGGPSRFGDYLYAAGGGGGCIPYHGGTPGSGGTVTGGVMSFPGNRGVLGTGMRGAGGASGSGMLYAGPGSPTYGNGGSGGWDDSSGEDGQPGLVVVRW